MRVLFFLRNLFESFLIKILFKLMMFAGLFLWIHYWVNPISYLGIFGSTTLICIFLSAPFLEIAVQLLSRFLPTLPVSVVKPEQEILGPFLCRPTTKSMGFWMASWESTELIEIEIFNGDKPVEVIALNCASTDFNTYIGETSTPLLPDTKYTYAVSLNKKPYSPPWNKGFHFTTQSENKEKEVRFFSMSCHGVREWEKSHENSTTWNMWSRLYNISEQSEIAFGVLGGDQVYMDSQFENRIGTYGQLKPQDKIALIKEVYFCYWSNQNYQKVLCKIPTFLMWDDHDILDGFGSRPDSFDGNELNSDWALFKKDLSAAFFAFQACRNPYTNQMRDNYSFTFESKQLKLVGLDLRGERNVKKEQMLSLESKVKVESALLSTNDKPLFILSPVTLTRISGPIEEFLSQFSNTVWRYTRFMGYGPSFKKVLTWLTLFTLSFLALQINDEHVSNLSSAIFLVGVTIYNLGAFALRKISGEKSEIEGTALKWIHRTLALIFAIGAAGIYFESQKGTFDFSTIIHQLKLYLETEAHNLSLLFGCLSISLVLLFDAKRLKEHSPKGHKTVSIIAFILLGLFGAMLVWHGLPDDYIRENFILKAPLAILSFLYLSTTILEAMGAVDEIAGLDDDIKDSWSSEPNAKELRWLLGVVKDLKIPTFFLCGDIHTGGLSRIKVGDKTIPQITTSPITYPPMAPMAEKLTSGLKKMALPKANPVAIAENGFFISQRNFGIISVRPNNQTTVAYIFEEQETDIEVVLKST